MFEAFKEKHGGLGPAAYLFDESTHGLLSSRAQRAAIGQQMDETLAAIRADDTVSPEFKKRAGELLAHGVYDAATAIKNIAAVSQGASDQSTAQRGFDAFSAQQEKLRTHAIGPNDLDQLDTFDVQAATARDQMRSLDPEVVKEGRALFASVQAAQRDYLKTNETQRIEADNLKNSNSVAAQKVKDDRDWGITTALEQRVKPLDTQLDALDTAYALNNDKKADNIQRLMAFNNVVTALDPGGRRDPDGRYAGANGLAIQLQNAYERAAGQKDTDAFKAVNEIIETASAQLTKQRDRERMSARAQSTAYGGDPEKVLAGFPDRPPTKGATTDVTAKPTNAVVTDNQQPHKPSGVEKIAAAAKAATDVINSNVSPELKTAALTSAGISLPSLLKWGIGASPALAAMGGMLALTASPPGKLAGESDEEYDARLSAMMAGEDIGMPRAKPLNTDEFTR